MAKPADLEARIGVLEAINAIKKLKYKYARCLDSKQWDKMAECFTEDATTDYSDGKFKFQGVEAIMQFLEENLGSHSRVTAHHVGQPEIEITSDTTAKGTWTMHDYVIDTSMNISLRGAAFYYDEYVKQDGEWKIKSTGYTRVFEEMASREGITLTATKQYSSA